MLRSRIMLGVFGAGIMLLLGCPPKGGRPTQTGGTGGSSTSGTGGAKPGGTGGGMGGGVAGMGMGTGGNASTGGSAAWPIAERVAPRVGSATSLA